MKAAIALLRRRTVDLVLIVVALAAVMAVVATAGRVTTGEADARSSNMLSVWRPDDVTRLSLDRPQEHVVLERGSGSDAGAAQWTIALPIHEAADAYAVDKLLGSLDHATWVRRLDSGSVDIKQLGLETPRVEIKIQMGSVGISLLLGNPAPSPAGAAYVQVTSDGAPGGGVMIVPKDVVTALDVGLSDLRTRDLVPYERTELGRISVVKGNQRVDVSRTDWGDWLTSKGVRAERSAVERMMVGLERASVDRVVPLPEASRVLEQSARLAVEVAPRQPGRPVVKLELGGKCPGDSTLAVVIRRAPDPMAGCVVASVPAALESASNEMRSQSLFWLHPDEVEELDIELEGEKLVLEREGSGFLLRSPQKGDVELSAGNERLQAITSLTGTLLELGAPAPGLDAPIGHVTLRSSGATEADVRTETVELGRRRPDGSFAIRRKRDGAVLELPGLALHPLTPDATLLRTRKILEFPPNDVTEVRVHSDRVDERIARRADGVLELVEPRGFGFDSTVIDDLVRALSTLSAERWVADRDEGSFGLAHPHLELHLRLSGDGGAAERILRVGDPTQGGSFAALDGSGGVFVVSTQTVEALDTLVLDRGLFALTVDVTQRIELEAGSRKLELVRAGDRFVERHGGTRSPAQIQTIVDALSGLRAEAALHLGAPRPEEGFGSPALVVRYALEDGTTRQWRLGAGDSWRSISIHYARVGGVDATYAIARGPVQAVLGAL